MRGRTPDQPAERSERPRRARKRFAQHFLEAAWVRKLVDAIDPSSEDRFLEIGSGRGALTLALAPHVKQLVAVELDRDLATELTARVPPHVTVVAADFLRARLPELLRERFGEHTPVRVAGNLPYNISSPILFRLLEGHLQTGRLIDATLLLQREVVDRITADPGNGDYGVLSVLLQLHAEASRLLSVPPGAFRPSPEVTSAVVRLRFRPPAVQTHDPALFERMVRTVFQQRRKTLSNTLKLMAGSVPVSPAEALARIGLDGIRRPETLSLAELARLADALAGAPSRH